jgi:hypothetical protein
MFSMRRKARDIMDAISSPAAQENFARGAIACDADMAVRLRVPFGVFEIIGLDAAPHILKIKRGKARDVLEEASLAYQEMKKRLDPEGRFFATYVNQLEARLQEVCRLRKDAVLGELVTTGFQRFRERYSIPAEDSPERRALMRQLFESVIPPEARHRTLLNGLPTLRRLWELRDELAHPAPEGGTIDPLRDVGLELMPLCRRHYFCTPLNAETFAAVFFGEGTHFSLLECRDDLHDNVPVVMTVPSAMPLNYVIGENLRDFLALGVDCGYSVLEQIAFVGPRSIDFRDSADQSESQRTTLRRIKDAFRLQPWENPVERLQALKETYAPTIRYPVDLFD